MYTSQDDPGDGKVMLCRPTWEYMDMSWRLWTWLNLFPSFSWVGSHFSLVWQKYNPHPHRSPNEGCHWSWESSQKHTWHFGCVGERNCILQRRLASAPQCTNWWTLPNSYGPLVSPPQRSIASKQTAHSRGSSPVEHEVQTLICQASTMYCMFAARHVERLGSSWRNLS